MKKIILLSCAVLLCQWSNAQWFGQNKIKGNGNVIQENRNTTSYDHIELQGFFEVQLVSGTEGSITITGEENLIPHIITEVNGNHLVIKTERGYNLQPSKRTGILVLVPFESLNQVSLSGSGDISSQNVIKSTAFKTKLTGSGDIRLSLDVEIAETTLTGSGDIELQGSAQKVVHQLTGSGDIEAFDLKAVDSQADITGSGDIDLYCSGSLKVRISGSGDVTYIGNPSQEDSKISGSGDVSKG
ncbi:head GIN domain-containing protein [Galbibacter sp.]|jgi:hypothetical protein|uniref:head GIN domain-containing protein n=1 Tax=Galbibacter sp. TaxID=2918471 RepID=UPI003A8F8BC6